MHEVAGVPSWVALAYLIGVGVARLLFGREKKDSYL